MPKPQFFQVQIPEGVHQMAWGFQARESASLCHAPMFDLKAVASHSGNSFVTSKLASAAVKPACLNSLPQGSRSRGALPSQGGAAAQTTQSGFGTNAARHCQPKDHESAVECCLTWMQQEACRHLMRRSTCTVRMLKENNDPAQWCVTLGKRGNGSPLFVL